MDAIMPNAEKLCVYEYSVFFLPPQMWNSRIRRGQHAYKEGEPSPARK